MRSGAPVWTPMRTRTSPSWSCWIARAAATARSGVAHGARNARHTPRRAWRVGVGDRRRELVAVAVDLVSAGRRDGGAHLRPVRLQRRGIRVAELLDEPRRALDVREK